MKNTMRTYSGIIVDILDPEITDINRADIAHALSMICRFNGHTSKFYSVAEHSILVSELIVHINRHRLPLDLINLEMAGLLHDATEAYLGDVIRPLKKSFVMKDYIKVEANLHDLINLKFDLPFTSSHPDIKLADEIALSVEQRDLMGLRDISLRDSDVEVYHIPPVKCYSPHEAEHRFLRRLHSLENARLQFQ